MYMYIYKQLLGKPFKNRKRLHYPLIGRDIFDFSRTTPCEVTRLNRNIFSGGYEVLELFTGFQILK
jgi:hypothetical protein